MRRLFALVLSLALLCPAVGRFRPRHPARVYRCPVGGLRRRTLRGHRRVLRRHPQPFRYRRHLLGGVYGFVLGTGWGRFDPDRPITREEAAVVLRRVGNFLGFDTAPSAI